MKSPHQRRPVPRHNKEAHLVLACDVGGTSIKLGLIRDRIILRRTSLDANAGEGLAAGLVRISKAARSLCRQAGLRVDKFCGFGLSFPGIVDPRTERILSTPAGKFADAPRLDVSAIVQDQLGLPVYVGNDANAALAGEWRFGAARKFQNAVMMTLGTGIGTSVIIEGQPLRGRHGQAGCLGGHLTINPQGAKCGCGNVGCAEAEASTWALPDQARAHPGFARSRLARVKILDYAAVFAAAARLDPVALELRDRAIRIWAATVVNLIHAYDPECVVLGGGIMRSQRDILPPLKRHVSRHAWTPWGRVKIRPAALGNDAGMFGVAAAFLEAH